MQTTPQRSALGGATLNHLELYTPDAATASAELADRYGLRVLANRTGAGDDHTTVVLGAGSIILAVTEGRAAGHPATGYAAVHGLGVADIALRTSDAAAAYRAATAGGARGRREPVVAPDGSVTATIAGFGDVVHTLVQPPPGVSGDWLPGVGALSVPSGSSTCVERVDHLAVCVPAGELVPTVRFYEKALGMRTIFGERIEVGAQAMESQVVQSASGDVTLTLIQPDASGEPGQIDRFLRDHGGAGVQHIAFATRNIVRSTAVLAERGVEFLSTPDAYYNLLTRRLQPSRHPIDELRDLDILADEDHDGQLYQIFTRSTHPRATLFYEIIERLGARTFGSGNIKALYEAVEQEELAIQVGR
jgi:4-hydroxymandelate synthase